MRWNLVARATACTAAIAVCCSLGSASAQTLIAPSTWTFDADVLALRLHNSVGTGDSNVFDFEAGTRLALTYLGDSGVGVRTTWFQWDHAREDSVTGEIALDTYNLDFEILKRLNLTQRSILEMSGGVRYNDTDHTYDGDPNDFTGFGGLLGIRGGLRVRDNGLLYARGKFAILMGDGAHDGDDEELYPANEVARSQTEIGFGYEHRFQLGNIVIVPRTGLEWQIWEGFGVDPVDEHPDTDLGFVGFVGGLGILF